MLDPMRFAACPTRCELQNAICRLLLALGRGGQYLEWLVVSYRMGVGVGPMGLSAFGDRHDHDHDHHQYDWPDE